MREETPKYAIAHVSLGFALDQSFGVNGYLVITGGCSQLLGRQCVSVLGDGTLAVLTSENGDLSGLTHNPAVPLHELRLFNTKGKPVKTVDLPDFSVGMVQMLTGPDGVPLMAGPTPKGFAVRRLTPWNSFDSRFGGEVENGYQHADSVWGLSRSDSGEWLVSGGSRPTTDTFPFVAKLKTDPQTVSIVRPDAPVALDRRTGLMRQYVKVYNHSEFSVFQLTLRVANLPPGVSVWKGIKENNKASWLLPVPPVDANGVTDFYLEYYVPSHKELVIMPTLELVNDGN